MASTLLDLNGPGGKPVTSIDKYKVVAESFGFPRPLTVHEMGGHNLAYQEPVRRLPHYTRTAAAWSVGRVCRSEIIQLSNHAW